MKLDYLNEMTDNGRYPDADPDKLIRLYDFEPAEARKLQEAIRYQIISRGLPLALSTLPFIQSVNCQLTLVPAEEHLGIKTLSNSTDFTGIFTIASFLEMLEIIHPFTEDTNGLHGYNWLYDPGIDEIDLLLSPGGGW